MNTRIWRRAALLATGLLATGAALAACSVSNVAENRAEPTAAKDPKLEEWHKVIAKTPSPKDGCFRSSYPSTTWIEVPCEPAPPGPFVTPHPPSANTEPRGPEAQSRAAPSPGPGSQGNGADWFLHESAPITEATGTFPSVIGATSPSSYSIQLNTNAFTRVATSDPALAAWCPSGSCQVWQQVLYSTTNARTGLYFQYWVLNGGNCSELALFGDWTAGSNGGCFLNSASVSNVPLVPLSDLSTMSVNVVAGSSDQLTMTIEGTAYRASFASELGLNQANWNQVEYGVFGDLGLRSAQLSPDTTITTQILTEPYTNTASCSAGAANGATGETNNLGDPSNDGGPPTNCCLASNGDQSGITFTESNTPGQACTVCGNENQACCNVSAAGWCASPNDICYLGQCTACGGYGEPCCPGSRCNVAGESCQLGSCGPTNEYAPSCPGPNYWTCSGGQSEAIFNCNSPAQPPSSSSGMSLVLEREVGGTFQKVNGTITQDAVTGQWSIRELGFVPPAGQTSTTYEVCQTGYGLTECGPPITLTGTTACQCFPTTCQAQNACNTQIFDGCSTWLSCGGCSNGEACYSGQCKCPSGEVLCPATGTCTTSTRCQALSGGGGQCKPGTCS